MSASTSARWRTRRPLAARGDELRLVLGDGARDDHLHVRVQVRRDRARARRRCPRRAAPRRAAGERSQPETVAAVAAQHAGDARHAGAADAEQVHLGAHGRRSRKAQELARDGARRHRAARS